ncbi:tigger transposable element-derived protein 1 [Trichonephila clavipes]|nr:tigger transposable element-derived protein 1 [Trichonephila clavipes]
MHVGVSGPTKTPTAVGVRSSDVTQGRVRQQMKEQQKYFQRSYSREDGDYSSDQVFNADETGLYWKKLLNHTYIAKDEKTASGHKASKDRVTLLLCINASGDRMLKSLLINKSLRPRALKDELLVDDALSDNDIIDLTLDLTVDGVVGLEGDNDEEEKSSSLTGKLIQEGLQLCSKLENHFLINDPNSERAYKLQRRATQNENEVCENPWPLPQISIAERVSSDDEGDLKPLRKRCKPLSDSDND